jgi:hypothetical protein
MVYATSSPAITGSSRSVRDEVADEVTVSTSVAESSEDRFRDRVTVMEAVFATVGDAYPGGMKARELAGDGANGAIGAVVVHVNVPAAIAHWARSRSRRPAGMGSDTTTPASAIEGPPFVSVIVYVVECRKRPRRRRALHDHHVHLGDHERPFRVSVVARHGVGVVESPSRCPVRPTGVAGSSRGRDGDRPVAPARGSRRTGACSAFLQAPALATM